MGRRTAGVGLVVALALGCRDPEPSPRAARVEGPDQLWRSPSGLVSLRWTATRWEARDGRFLAQLRLQTPEAPGLPPITWTLHDPVGPIASGSLGVANGAARVVAELPAPPPRVLALELEVGAPDARWSPVHTPGAEGLVVRVPAGSPQVPHVTVPRISEPPVIDGRLDDPAWSGAPILALSDSMGRPGAPPPERKTTVRLLWDDANLYVGFRANDPDVSERFEERDDPIYEHEAVEIFLMPHAAGPRTGPYVELQASPTGVIFDASFTGPRRGMAPGWDGAQTVASRVEGSLNDRRADTAWISEWKVPFEGLRWARKIPKAGDVWRMNAFRIDRSRGRPDLYLAWSPPRVGDFHRVERFGFLEFGARTSTTSP